MNWPTLSPARVGWFLLVCLIAAPPLRAQTVSTVRETEFRSRWVDQQVDRPAQEFQPGSGALDGDGDFTTRVGDTLRSFFRTGPVVLRAGLSAGFEYSNQQTVAIGNPPASEASFFVAPVVALFYDREVGPWTVSARYSVGYLYYFDREYLALGGRQATPDTTQTVVVEPAQPERTVLVPTTPLTNLGGINQRVPQFRTVTIPAVPAVTEEVTVPGLKADPRRNSLPSQTLGLDIALQYSRLKLRSNGGGSYGSGFDIERSGQSNRLSLFETLTADYQLTEYVRAGVGFNAGYEGNEGGAGTQDSSTRFSGSLYVDYFLTGKSRLRLEASAGREAQTLGNGDPLERTYSQALLRWNFLPTEKLSFEVGLGVGVLDSSGAATTVTNQDGGLRAVYSVRANYAPTSKIAAAFYFGLETTSTTPDLSLSLDWRPRETTAFRVSLYQLSGVSTISFSQNRVSRGFLVLAQQRILQRAMFSISGGVEEFEDLDVAQVSPNQEPYSFLGAGFTYEFSRWLSFDSQYRTATGTTSAGQTSTSRETRASVGLRLTF